MEEYIDTGTIPGKGGPKSIFNSAGLINARLHDSWKLASNAALSGKYNTWNTILDNIWRELGGEYEINSEEMIEYDNYNNLLKFAKNWTVSDSGFKKRTSDEMKEMARQYVILRRKELFITRIQNKQGKGTAYADEDSDMM